MSSSKRMEAIFYLKLFIKFNFSCYLSYTVTVDVHITDGHIMRTVHVLYKQAPCAPDVILPDTDWMSARTIQRNLLMSAVYQIFCE